jgi:hypothetical protein
MPFTSVLLLRCEWMYRISAKHKITTCVVSGCRIRTSSLRKGALFHFERPQSILGLSLRIAVPALNRPPGELGSVHCGW